MKSIALSEGAHKEVKILCKTLGLNIGEFVQQSAYYFKKTGINPSKSDSESPHKVVKELERRIGQGIAYIKTHEQEKINPLLENIMMLVRRLEMTLNDAPKEATFKAVITRMETMMEEDQKYHNEQLKAQHKFYTESLERILKNHDQTNAEGIKKMNEVLLKMNN